MKIRPKPQEMPFNEEDFDNYGLYIDWIPTGKRNKYKLFQAKQFLHEDDLYDENIELETRAQINFTEKIPLSLYELLTDSEKIKYHEFLIRSAQDEHSESLT